MCCFGIPKVDRGPTDPPNIICVITEQNKKDYINLEQNMVYLKDGLVVNV